MPPSLRFSRCIAIVYGVLIVMMETVRRKEQLLDPSAFMLWFDDYILGGFLLWAGWRAGKDSVGKGARYLSAAWGVAVGGMFMSLRWQVNHLNVPDATPLISSTGVAVIKGLLFLAAVIGLVVSLCQPDRQR